MLSRFNSNQIRLFFLQILHYYPGLMYRRNRRRSSDTAHRSLGYATAPNQRRLPLGMIGTTSGNGGNHRARSGGALNIFLKPFLKAGIDTPVTLKKTLLTGGGTPGAPATYSLTAKMFIKKHKQKQVFRDFKKPAFVQPVNSRSVPEIESSSCRSAGLIQHYRYSRRPCCIGNVPQLTSAW